MRMGRDLSWQIRLYDLESCLGLVSKRLSDVWSATCGGQVRFESGQWLSRTAGLTYHGLWQAGGQLRLVQDQGRLLKGVTGFASLPLGKIETLHCYFSVLSDPEDQSRMYELQLLQTGRHQTPGILLTGNDAGVERLEGYLMWTF